MTDPSIFKRLNQWMEPLLPELRRKSDLERETFLQQCYHDFVHVQGCSPEQADVLCGHLRNLIELPESTLTNSVELRLGTIVVETITKLLEPVHSHAQLFRDWYDGRCRVTDVKHSVIWLWSPEEKLWRQMAMPSLEQRISDFMYNAISNYVRALREAMDGASNAAEWEDRFKKLVSAWLRTKTRHYASDVANYCKDLCLDRDFYVKLDANGFILPIQGGFVVDLRTGEVRDRLLTDYCTLECPVTWKPQAERTLIDRFIGD
jgi:hypothetical protein